MDSIDFYNSIAAEITAQVQAETKGMSDADLAAYSLQSARAHLAELRKIKASDVLIEWAELRVTRLAKELSDLARDTGNQEQAGSSG